MAAITIPVILPASNPTPAPPAAPGGPSPTPGTSPPPIPGTTIPVPGTSPTPTPEPPSAPPPSGGGSCSLPPGDPNASCSRTGETFLGDVEEAIDRVVDRNPGLFDRDDKACNNCYRILDHPRLFDRFLSYLFFDRRALLSLGVQHLADLRGVDSLGRRRGKGLDRLAYLGR